jgi:hypothetical protein
MRSLLFPLPLLLVVVCLFPLLVGSFTPDLMTHHRSSSRRIRRRMTCSTSSLKVAAVTTTTANNNSILPRLVSVSNTNDEDRNSDDNPRIGVLLLNLGGPETGDDVEGTRGWKNA